MQPDDVLGKVAAGARLLRAWPLIGGVSARVTALDVRRSDGEVERLVVREYGERDLRAAPDIAQRDYGLLDALRRVGLPVPAPRYAGAGVLVTDFVDGQTEFQPADETGFVGQLAEFLARLHRVDASGLPGLPPLSPPGPRPAVPDDSLSETRLRTALDRCGPPASARAAVLHGDFWPGNVLWRGGRLAAVIDWEDAAVGDPQFDVANARLELLFFLGPDVMSAFTRDYAAFTGAALAGLPYWDLRAALRPCGRLGSWGLEADEEARLRGRHAWFVGRALAAL